MAVHYAACLPGGKSFAFQDVDLPQSRQLGSSHVWLYSAFSVPAKESGLPTLIAQPTRIQAAGTKPKLIDEYIGRVSSKTPAASVAYMRSPAGWEEPGQRPEFDEFTIVLKGAVRVKHETGSLDAREGQAVIAHKGEWIQYSTPDGAEYIAVCLPAFSPETVHRDK